MRWAFSIVVVIFGLCVADFDSLKWTIITIALFSVPLLMQLMRSGNLRIYSLWLGFFLVIQTLISPILIDRDLITLPPRMHEIKDVTTGLPGIQGEQVITTDFKGFRTSGQVEYDRNEAYRIFAIGGSTTEQLLLDDRATWTHLLQEQLTEELKLEVEVINTGVSGLRATHHLATLKYILGMHPDMVIFLLGINDWNHQLKNALSETERVEGLAAFRKNYAFKTTLLANLIGLIYSSASSQKSVNEKPVIQEERGEYYTHQRNSLGRAEVRRFKPSQVSEEYREKLVAISETCLQNGIECLFITQPSGYQAGATEEYKKGFWMTPPNQAYTLDFDSMIHIASLYNSYLKQFSSDRGHYACDAASELLPTFDVFYDDCHFNTNGAVIMSKVVSSCVTDIFAQRRETQLGLLQDVFVNGSQTDSSLERNPL